MLEEKVFQNIRKKMEEVRPKGYLPGNIEAIADPDRMKYIFEQDMEMTELIIDGKLNDIIIWLSRNLEKQETLEKFKEVKYNTLITDFLQGICRKIEKDSTFYNSIRAMQKNAGIMLGMEEVLEKSEGMFALGCKIYAEFDGVHTKAVDEYCQQCEEKEANATLDDYLLGEIAGLLLSEETLKVINRYQKKTEAVAVESIILAFDLAEDEPEEFHEWIDTLKEDKTIDMFEDARYIGEVIALGHQTIFDYSGFLQRHAKRKNIQDAAWVLSRRLSEREPLINIAKKEFDVLDKYMDSDVVMQKLTTDLWNVDVYDALLSDDVYQRLQKDPEYIHSIADNEYASFIRILDDEMIAEMPEGYLESAKKTLNLVMDVHRQRNLEQKMDLREGFLEEMKRAISQGKDCKSRIRYFREYCREVQDQMRENIDELLVMHNDS